MFHSGVSIKMLFWISTKQLASAIIDDAVIGLGRSVRCFVWVLSVICFECSCQLFTSHLALGNVDFCMLIFNLRSWSSMNERCWLLHYPSLLWAPFENTSPVVSTIAIAVQNHLAAVLQMKPLEPLLSNSPFMSVLPWRWISSCITMFSDLKHKVMP